MPNIKSAIKRVRTTENLKLVIFHKKRYAYCVKNAKSTINADNKVN